jgi:tetratricopeptide (TPR) repeat protein
MPVHIRTLVAAAALSFSVAVHAGTNLQDLQFYRQKVASANALMQNEDYAAADRVFATLVDSPQLKSLQDQEARSVLSAAGWSAARNGELPRARALLLRARQIDDNDPDIWYRLALVELDLEHNEAAARAYIELAERWPELLANIDNDPLYLLIRRLGAAPPAKSDLLQTLFDANWDDPENDPSELWYELALFRVESGELDRARAAVKRVTSPRTLVLLRSDKRFDPIVERSTWAFNVEAAAKRAVEVMEAKAARDPQKLEPKVQLTYAMLVAGMNDEVVALVDELTDTIAQAPTEDPSFKDVNQQVWLMNNRAIALRRLGRIDEAEADLRRASELTERGTLNVNQALNLSSFYCNLGRPDQALAALETVGDTISGYGRMVENLVRLCAASQKHDEAGAKRSLAYLRAHRQDGQTAYLEGLVRLGREAQAAKHLIGLLESPADRSDALEWIQTYRTSEPLPGDRQARANSDKLLAREDVRTAVERVGRIERYEVNTGYGME